MPVPFNLGLKTMRADSMTTFFEQNWVAQNFIARRALVFLFQRINKQDFETFFQELWHRTGRRLASHTCQTIGDAVSTASRLRTLNASLASRHTLLELRKELLSVEQHCFSTAKEKFKAPSAYVVISFLTLPGNVIRAEAYF